VNKTKGEESLWVSESTLILSFEAL
jgi:hypothetical protein